MRPLNNRGFTLIEMLYGLVIFMVLTSLLSFGTRIIVQNSILHSGYKKMEWEVFNSQVKKEIRSAEQITVLEDKILMKKDGRIILYEKYGTKLRRRVDYQGHEILLQDIASFHFENMPASVGIFVKDVNGDDFSTIVYNFIRKEEVSP